MYKNNLSFSVKFIIKSPPISFFIYYITKFPHILVVIEQKSILEIRCSKKICTGD
nr:MAG TPA: hypothetical protein [Caudoviricetes sp.]